MVGINIDSEIASKENIPEDLNSLAYSAYRIPNINRRKLTGYFLCTLFLSIFVIDYFYHWINFSYTYPILFLVTIYVFLIKSKISVKQSEVIELVGKYVDHSVGYYSVALTFQGFRLKPIWTCIIYNHANPPKKKSIVEIDANTSELLGSVVTEELKQ